MDRSDVFKALFSICVVSFIGFSLLGLGFGLINEPILSIRLFILGMVLLVTACIANIQLNKYDRSPLIIRANQVNEFKPWITIDPDSE